MRGDIPAMFAIYDTMQYIKPDVSTTVMCQAASAAAVLLLAGTKGKRYALPHSRVLLHQPHGGAEGQAVDIEIQAKEMTRYRKLMEQLIAEHTSQPTLCQAIRSQRAKMDQSPSAKPVPVAPSPPSLEIPCSYLKRGDRLSE